MCQSNNANRFRLFGKFISFLLCLVVLLSVFFSIPFAGYFPKEKTEKINEWDEYKRITALTDDELEKNGYSKAQISKIRSFDFSDEIRKTAKLSDDILKKYGYSEDKINKIRFIATQDNITESMIKSISTSTMTTSLRYVSNGSRTEGGRTMYYVNMKFSWNWNSIPFFRFTDMIAVAFDSNQTPKFTYSAVSGNNVHCDLIAYMPNCSTRTQTVNWSFSTSQANAISASFAISMNDISGQMTHFVKSGYGTFQLTNRSNNVRLYCDAAYGHKVIATNPSFSVTGSGINIGLDFGLGMDEQHCTGYFLENFTITSNYIYNGTVYGKNNTGGSAS